MSFDDEPASGPAPLSIEYDPEASIVELNDVAAKPAAPVLAPYALLRFATLPYRLLERVRLPGTTAAIDAQWRAEQAMAMEAGRLNEPLFALVSRIAAADKHYRRKVLQLKREIHNATGTRLEAALIERIRQDLATQDDGDAAALARWLEAQTALLAAQTRAAALLEWELTQDLRPRLREVLGQPLFRRALALASPGLIAHAQREKQLPQKSAPDNFERSLLGYLIRATAKTSPFSSFMSTTAIGFDDSSRSELSLRGLVHECSTRLNRGLLARIHRSAMSLAGDDSGLLFKANPTLAPIGPQRFRGLVDRELVVLGRPWRQQSRSNFQLHESLSVALVGSSEALTAAQWRERFTATGVPAARVGELIGQLLGRGLLQAPAFTDAFDETPEATLSARLAQHLPPPAEPVRRDLAAMIETCRNVGAGDSEADRVGGVERIRELEKSLLANTGAGVVEPLQNVVLEDCWSTGTSAVGMPQIAALADLNQFLSTQIGISPLYLRLRDRFIARFGVGGRCDDLPGFLIESGSQLFTQREYGDTRGEDEALAAPSGARMAVTVQLQVIAGDDRARPQIVVNKVFENAGWLAARFSTGATPEHARLRDGIRRWLVTVAGDGEPVDMLVNGDCNDLQVHPRLTPRVLRWPGEPVLVDDEEAVDLDQLRLVHDPVSGLLELSHRDGGKVVLCYLGATLANPAWGVSYALSILTQPYHLLRPTQRPASTGGSESADVEFIPRMMAGRAVLRRAVWWIRTDYLKRAWFGGDGVQRLLDVRRDCRRLGIPTSFFARRQVEGQGGVSTHALDANRKPLWVSIDNPFCLELLKRLGEGVEWMSITEALPGPDQLWLDIDGERHVSELQVEMLLQAV